MLRKLISDNILNTKNSDTIDITNTNINTNTTERWQVIDQNFINNISSNNLNNINIYDKNYSKNLLNIINQQDYLDLLTQQLICRNIDLFARELKQKNLGFYSIASSGHENNIAVSYCSDISDPALLHYRSSAFMLNRAYRYNNKQGLEQEVINQLRSLIASKLEPVSNGRHKVFGNIKLNVPPQTSTIASHLPKAVGLALSINTNKIIKNKIKSQLDIKSNNIVICSFGDASYNHSTAQGAINTASILSYQNIPVPILFVCEDNNIGISVKTPDNWIENSISNNKNIFYIKANGLNLLDVLDKSKKAVDYCRLYKKPVFLHINTVRLMGHAGSDIEKSYLSDNEILNNELHDPLLYTAKIGLELNYINNKSILKLFNNIKNNIKDLFKDIINDPKLSNNSEIMSAIISCGSNNKNKYILKQPRYISQINKNKLFKAIVPNWSSELKRNMAQMITLVLAEILAQYKNTVIFGEDVGKKGGVYNITNNLQKAFGRKRVFDTILDETTILGTAIGFAQNNLLPIVEIQFLAYLHNAIDQLRGEAASQSFFSAGRLSNPMIIRIPGFAYQKGFGGHFHNDNSIAALRDIPGIIIATPSNGIDAVNILRVLAKQAYTKARICVFIEPIALYYNKEDNNTYPEYDNNNLLLGDIGVTKLNKNIKNNNKLIILSYANGHNLAKQSVEILLNKNNINLKSNIDLIDIRWLKPLPITNIFNYIINEHKEYNNINILIIDECRQTGSVSEELLSLIYEKLAAHKINFKQNKDILNNIKLHRLTADDSFIPLGPAAECVLPSVQSIKDKIITIITGITSE